MVEALIRRAVCLASAEFVTTVMPIEAEPPVGNPMCRSVGSSDAPDSLGTETALPAGERAVVVPLVKESRMDATLVNKTFLVRAPATSANLGPGFDAGGLALNWWNTLRVEPGPKRPHPVVVTNVGREAETIPVGRDNLLIEAMLRLCQQVGRPLPPVELKLELGFPLGRGFGSSATAIVLGLLAVRELVAADLSSTEVFELASAVEGHPDNVAPCLFGGATWCWNESGHFHCQALEVHPDLTAVALVAPQPSGTKMARRALPEMVKFGDASWTAGRAALLPLALAGAFELLLPATEDVLHQEVRLAAWSEAAQTLKLLRAKGHAAFVSGAGPSLLVLCPRERRSAVRRETKEALEGLSNWELLDLELARAGAEVVAV